MDALAPQSGAASAHPRILGAAVRFSFNPILHVLVGIEVTVHALPPVRPNPHTASMHALLARILVQSAPPASRHPLTVEARSPLTCWNAYYHAI
ncbi:hypothetical protein EON66_01745 [archaeon]|nr:MAG: hypothetical protein EON66_01745 [archaeon]